MDLDYSASKEIICAEGNELLKPDEREFINEHIEDLNAIWKKRQIYRTETEMRMSVLNDVKFPTPAAKYWQAVRECSGFYDSLCQDSFSFRRNELRLTKLRRKLENTTDDIKRAEIQISIEEVEYAQMNIAAGARDRIRELRLWQKIMAELVEQDPTFNTEDVNEHQLLSYNIRFTEQFKHKNQTASPGELANIIGHKVTSDRLLKERGLDKVQMQAKIQLHEAK